MDHRVGFCHHRFLKHRRDIGSWSLFAIIAFYGISRILGIGFGFCHRRFLKHRRDIGLGLFCYHRFLKHKQDIGFGLHNWILGLTLDILDLNYVLKKIEVD